jgi:hypothetical protein
VQRREGETKQKGKTQMYLNHSSGHLERPNSFLVPNFSFEKQLAIESPAH